MEGVEAKTRGPARTRKDTELDAREHLTMYQEVPTKYQLMTHKPGFCYPDATQIQAGQRAHPPQGQKSSQ